MRRIRLAFFACLVASSPHAASAQEPSDAAHIDGAFRLGLTGTILGFGRTHRTIDDFGITTEITEKDRSVGFGFRAAGLELGYGVSSFAVLGLRIGYAYTSSPAATEFDPDFKSSSLELVPGIMLIGPTR